VWAAVENLRGLGKTIMLTTHYLDEAERLADQVAILLDGRIKIAGSTREVARLAALPSRISFAAPQALRAKELAPPDGIDLVVSGLTASCQTRTPAATLRALLDWADHHQLGDLDELAVASPSLEDAYLHHVESTDGAPRA
jgi:ABC-2 type transport system ATP-binding protein